MSRKYSIGILTTGITFFTILTLYSRYYRFSAIEISSNNTVNQTSLDELTPTPLEYLIISETPIPTVTPKPSATATPTKIQFQFSDLDSLFIKYANQQSINKDLLKKIAVCESNLNPSAVNGDYVGLFQYSSSYWTSMRKRMNLDGNPALRFHAEESIKTAAFTLATAGFAAWPHCSK